MKIFSSVLALTILQVCIAPAILNTENANWDVKAISAWLETPSRIDSIAPNGFRPYTKYQFDTKTDSSLLNATQFVFHGKFMGSMMMSDDEFLAKDYTKMIFRAVGSIGTGVDPKSSRELVVGDWEYAVKSDVDVFSDFLQTIGLSHVPFPNMEELDVNQLIVEQNTTMLVMGESFAVMLKEKSKNLLFLTMNMDGQRFSVIVNTQVLKDYQNSKPANTRE